MSGGQPAAACGGPSNSAPSPRGCIARWQRIARRIRVPLAFLVAGLYLFELWRRPSHPAAIAWSLLLVLPGLALRGYASGYVKKNRVLTVTGPYAYTRNPLYLGSMLIAAGFAVALLSWLLAVVLAVGFAVIYIPVIASEERFLRNSFPAYEAYCRLVPRFVPRFAPRLIPRLIPPLTPVKSLGTDAEPGVPTDIRGPQEAISASWGGEGSSSVGCKTGVPADIRGPQEAISASWGGEGSSSVGWKTGVPTDVRGSREAISASLGGDKSLSLAQKSSSGGFSLALYLQHREYNAVIGAALLYLGLLFLRPALEAIPWIAR